MDDLKLIRTFIKVVEAGSFSAVARETSSVSSVARQIRALEDELGARLLNRNSRRLSLTYAGQRLYERAKGIVNDVDSVKSEVRSIQEEVKGTLRVALRTAAGTILVMPALPRLLEQYPDLELDIILTDERKDLIANQIDVAIWMGELPNADIIARRLITTKRIVCASKGYLDRHGIPQSPQDLRNHQCLLYTAPFYGREWVFRKGDEVIAVEVGGGVRADSGLVLLSSALMGLGMTVLPEWMVRSHLAEGAIVQVLGDFTVNPYPGHAEHYAVYPSSRGLSRKVRVFVDFLVEVFKGS